MYNWQRNRLTSDPLLNDTFNDYPVAWSRPASAVEIEDIPRTVQKIVQDDDIVSTSREKLEQ